MIIYECTLLLRVATYIRTYIDEYLCTYMPTCGKVEHHTLFDLPGHAPIPTRMSFNGIHCWGNVPRFASLLSSLY